MLWFICIFKLICSGGAAGFFCWEGSFFTQFNSCSDENQDKCLGFFSLNFITVISEKQCILVPDPHPLDLLIWFKQLGLLVQFCWCLVLVPEGRWSLLVFLKSVCVAVLCGKHQKFLSASEWGSFTSFVLWFPQRVAKHFLGLILCCSVWEKQQWHVCAVPRAFSSLGISVWSCPVSYGHLPKQDLWRTVPPLPLWRFSVCLINVKMKHALLDFWMLNQMSSLHYLQELPLSETWGL